MQNSNRDTPLASRVQETCSTIRARSALRPEFAIILGSGLGGLANEIDRTSSIPYAELPYFPKTSAAGHAGNLILGHIGNSPVVVLQGRFHCYEGHSNQTVAYPVNCVRELGAHSLIVTNAAGGLNPRFRKGDLMLIDQHIHWLWPRRGTNDCHQPDEAPVTVDSIGHAYRSGSIYCEELIQRSINCATQFGHGLQRGTYLSTLGPTYETRAEYRMFRWMGADAVGMSTTAEVIPAARLGMKVLGISVITNIASTDIPKETTHEEVIEAGKRAESLLKAIVMDIVAYKG